MISSQLVEQQKRNKTKQKQLLNIGWQICMSNGSAVASNFVNQPYTGTYTGTRLCSSFTKKKTTTLWLKYICLFWPVQAQHVLYALTYPAEHHIRRSTEDSVQSLCSPGGITVSVRRDPATGAIVLQWMSYLRPSMARVFESPTKPSLAAL